MQLTNIVAESRNKTIYRDGNKCIKMFHEGYSKADVLNEALNQARVEGTGIRVPRLLEVTTVSGRWAIVSEYIEGRTMESLFQEHPERQEELLDWFIDIQLSILSHTCPLLNDLKVKMTRKIDEAKLTPDLRYELHTRLSGVPPEKQVCHGDFNPTNIIITPANVPYIIDWAHVTQGNPVADAARTFLLFNLAGKDQLAQRYLDKFCERTQTAHQLVQKWMPILAASQSVKGHEEEREFLMSWADVADYQ